MKKIFTFLFLAGLTVTTMAQNGRYSQHRSQNGGNYDQPADNATNENAYPGAANGYGQPRQRNSEYGRQYGTNQGNDYNQSNGYHQQEQGFNHNNENEYGNNRLYEERRFHNNNRYDQRAYSYERRGEYERYNRGRFNQG